MKRRFITLMTTLLLSIMFAVSASAYDVEVDGIYYNYLSEKDVEVKSGDNKYTGDVVIPSSVVINEKECSVTSIGDYAFYGCNSLKTLYYDSSVNPKINSDLLSELYIGDNISIVYDYFNSSKLTKIVLGKNVTQVRANAFKNSQIEEFTVTGEEPPYMYTNVFGTQDLSKATLYVPESKTE